MRGVEWRVLKGRDTDVHSEIGNLSKVLKKSFVSFICVKNYEGKNGSWDGEPAGFQDVILCTLFSQFNQRTTAHLDNQLKLKSKPALNKVSGY